MTEFNEIQKQADEIIKKLSSRQPKFYVKSKKKWWNWIISPVAMYRELRTLRIVKELIDYQYKHCGMDKKLKKSVRELLIKGETEIKL